MNADSSKGPTLLVLSYSNLRSDPRVRRHITALAKRYRVVSCGYGEAPPGASRHAPIPVQRLGWAAKARGAAMLKPGLHELYYWRQPRVRATLAALEAERFDLVLANDLAALPVAFRLARRAPVLFDAHEYSPLEFEDRWLWRFFFAPYTEHLCRRYLPRATRMTTVCQGIAERYAAEFGVESEVIMNAPPRASLTVKTTAAASVRIVHHGAAIASRRIELMIGLMEHLDARFSLDLVLVPGDAAYIEALRRRAAGNPRIRFLPAVPMEQLVEFSAGYDVGLFLLPPTNFNYRMALPNKFFEFLQARLAVAIGPSPEMARLVRQYDCGLVADSFDPRALAALLNAATAADFDRMKRGADRAAAVLNAEANEGRFLSIVEELLGGAASGMPRAASA